MPGNAETVYLAIDLGAESGRAMVGTLRNARVELHEVHRSANVPFSSRSGLHWDMAGLWSHRREALRMAADWIYEPRDPAKSDAPYVRFIELLATVEPAKGTLSG